MDGKTVRRIRAFWWLGIAVSVSLNAQERKYPAPNPEPVIVPGTDLKKGREPGSYKTKEHNIAHHLDLLVTAYTQQVGTLPSTWEQLEKQFGNRVWDSLGEWEIIKRRFAFIGVEGHLPDSKENGPLEGQWVLAPLFPVNERRSEEKGRFTIWRGKTGRIVVMWLTESEVRTFSKWPDVERKLEAAKVAVETEA